MTEVWVTIWIDNGDVGGIWSSKELAEAEVWDIDEGDEPHLRAEPYTVDSGKPLWN